jgi:hypothetical protein
VFTPSRDEVRRFLTGAWQKRRTGQPASALEILAADVAALHPEYHALLESGDDALAREWTPLDGETNPFLHLSLHLAIEEQLSIDQPPGIVARFKQLLMKHRGDRHAAIHAVLDCLGETLWRAGRDQQPPDSAAYLACLARATGDNTSG